MFGLFFDDYYYYFSSYFFFYRFSLLVLILHPSCDIISFNVCVTGNLCSQWNQISYESIFHHIMFKNIFFYLLYLEMWMNFYHLVLTQSVIACEVIYLISFFILLLFHDHNYDACQILTFERIYFPKKKKDKTEFYVLLCCQQVECVFT